MQQPGSILDGKYEIVDGLGGGGMGEVWLARHLHLEQLRVIKILRRDLAADETAQKRFVREARLATEVKHPNVAILYDFHRLPDGSFYMVWEHIEGMDVATWLARHGPMPVAEAIQLGIQGLRGLEAMHANGVIHRDLSPDNLMLTEDRRGRRLVKIIDLGLAKNLVAAPNFEITQAGTFMGKLRYCSPEQAAAREGESLDARTDIYSFGQVLYEAVTGLAPFEADSPHGLVLQRLEKDPLPLVGRNPEIEVPPALEEVILGALARDREDRHPTAVAFIEALEKVAFGLREESPRAVPISDGDGAAAQATAASPARVRSGSDPASAGGSRAGGGRRVTRELSREERADLLSRIDRAARRRESSQRHPAVRPGAAAGQGTDRATPGTTEPAADPEPPTTASPPPPPPPKPPPAATPPREAPPAPAPGAASPPPSESVEPEPAAAEAHSTSEASIDTESPASSEDTEEAALARRIVELEGLIEGYIQKQQVPLAELALEALLEIAPTHRKRSDYESWLELSREESEANRQVAEAIAAGREALEREDLRTARRQLEAARRQDRDGAASEAFAAEIEAWEEARRSSAEAEDRRHRFDATLERGDLQTAETELAALEAAGTSRLVVDTLRERLAAAHREEELRGHVEAAEARFEERLAQRDWLGARKIVHQLEAIAPASPRPAELRAEVARREEAARHREAVAQGERQVEESIRAGRLEQAELGLQILLQMDPGNRRRRSFERQLKSLRRKA